MSTRTLAFLLSLGLGLVLGLATAWNILPAGVIVSEPGALKPEAREQYIVLVAMAYAQDGDLERANRRLAGLALPETRQTIAALAERYISEPKPDSQRRGLSRLAVALGADSVTLRLFVPQVPTPTLTDTPVPTPSVAATLPATATSVRPTPAAPRITPTTVFRMTYRLFEQVRLTCEQEKTPRARILVYVQDAAGRGLAGTRVQVQWNDGQDAFFTGLKGGDPGFADFDMQPGRSYNVQVSPGASQIATGLDSDQLQPDCPNDGKVHYSAWRIIFRRID